MEGTVSLGQLLLAQAAQLMTLALPANQILAFMNLLYIAKITSRIAIM